MAQLTRQQILARKVAGKTEPHTFDDGGTVIIRGLTLDESIEVRKLNEGGDLAAANAYMFHKALVDPQLSLADARAWSANDEAGDLTRLGNHISEISGLLEGAGKSRVSGARKRS